MSKLLFGTAAFVAGLVLLCSLQIAPSQADTSFQLQTRVSGTCGAGSAMQVINADGTVSCGATGVTGTGTSPDLAVWTGTGSVGNYAGSSPAACGAGSAVTQASLSASGALAYTCSAAGITNGAGNNVVAKSNGTNIVASDITDDGTTIDFTNGAAKATVAVSSGNLTLSGALVAGELDGTVQTTASCTGNLTDVAINANTTVLRINAGSGCNLLGIAAPSRQRLLWVVNSGTTVVTLVNESGSEATAANRLNLIGAQTYNMGNMSTSAGNGNGGTLLMYDTGQARWVALTGNGVYTGTTHVTGGLAVDSGGLSVVNGISVTSGATTLNGQYTWVARQVLTAASGTYTPTTGTRGAIVRMCGGGGGGGGAGGGANVAVGAGGNSGSWLETHVGFAGATITGGTYAAPAGGTGGTTAGGNGGTASDTTLTIGGSTLMAKGGVGGAGLTTTAPPFVWGPAACATGTTAGDFNGCTLGGAGIAVAAGSGLGGTGGSSPFGSGGLGAFANTGSNGLGYCSGGGGGGAQATGKAGGNGSQGVIIVDEYI